MQVNIIGCGRAAGSLARLGVAAQALDIGGVMNRTGASSRRAVESLGQGRVVGSLNEFEACGLWMVGVNDDEIAGVAQAMAASGLKFEGEIVFHLCGRFGPDILAPLIECGARLAAVHPVRSLTHEQLSLTEFDGTPCIAEGNVEALQALQPLFHAIRANWMPTGHIDRGLYHAAVSIISNITKGISWKTQTWLQDAGLDEAMAAQVNLELLGSTVSDLASYGARQSITGPIVRGDTQTIEAHLAALLAAHPQDVDVYCVLAKTVLELACERGDLSAETMEQFRAILSLGNSAS